MWGHGRAPHKTKEWGQVWRQPRQPPPLVGAVEAAGLALQRAYMDLAVEAWVVAAPGFLGLAAGVEVEVREPRSRRQL